MDDNPYTPQQSAIESTQTGVDLVAARRQYKYLTAAFLAYLPLFFYIFVLSTNRSQGPTPLVGVAFLLSAIACFIFIGLLARTNKKSPFVWAGLSLLATPIGIIVAYFMMQDVGKKNKWR